MARQELSKDSIFEESIFFQFGKWLRQMRTERDLVLREVAASLEMDTAHLSKIERGDRLPTTEQTTRLAHFYDIPVSEMEAARMAGKFLRELSGNPAAARTLEIVQESAAAFGNRSNKTKVKP